MRGISDRAGTARILPRISFENIHVSALVIKLENLTPCHPLLFYSRELANPTSKT
jgi:hypothetical protein